MDDTSKAPKIDFIKEFKRLLDEKQNQDKNSNRLRIHIANVIETFPEGITVQSVGELPRLYSQCYRFMPPQHCAVLLEPDIWSMVCDASDTILAMSSNLR